MQNIRTRVGAPTVLVVRPVDEACNLTCIYCNSAVYAGRERRMSKGLLDDLVRQAAESESRFVRFTWHGGEPLLAGLDFYEAIVELQRRHFGGMFHRARYENVLQTNALLLKGKLLDFLLQERFVISVSLDGPDVEANSLRFPKHHAAELLRRTLDRWTELRQRGQRLVVFAVIHRHNVHRADDLYRFFRDAGVDVVSFNPCFRRATFATENVNPKEYTAFLRRILELRDHDLRMGRQTISLGSFDQIISWAAGRESRLCYVTGRCHYFLNVNASGEIFATCTDELGVKLGSIAAGDLPHLIAGIQKGPIAAVQSLLGMPRGASAPSGCPKYSSGQGDSYIGPILELAHEHVEHQEITSKTQIA